MCLKADQHLLNVSIWSITRTQKTSIHLELCFQITIHGLNENKVFLWSVCSNFLVLLKRRCRQEAGLQSCASSNQLYPSFSRFWPINSLRILMQVLLARPCQHPCEYVQKFPTPPCITCDQRSNSLPGFDHKTRTQISNAKSPTETLDAGWKASLSSHSKQCNMQLSWKKPLYIFAVSGFQTLP